MLALFRDYDVMWPGASSEALGWFEVFNVGFTMLAPGQHSVHSVHSWERAPVLALQARWAACGHSACWPLLGPVSIRGDRCCGLLPPPPTPHTRSQPPFPPNFPPNRRVFLQQRQFLRCVHRADDAALCVRGHLCGRLLRR